jgi:hypothetical protein
MVSFEDKQVITRFARSGTYRRTARLSRTPVRARANIENYRGFQDQQVYWPVSLEHCLSVASGKATPEVSLAKLSDPAWQTNDPHFKTVLAEIAAWVDPAIKI